MKIGILTASRTDNNGTDLQMLAMQIIFRKYGATDLEIINYISPKIDGRRKLFKNLNLKKILKLPVTIFGHYQHESFRKRFINRTKDLYIQENLATSPFDKIIVGSDQIWNIDLTDGDLGFYLPFNTSAKKYSYAVSMGTAKLENWNKKYNIFQLLDSFEVVSLRESFSAQLIREKGIEAQQDLDPILMTNSTDWDRYTIYPKHKNYLLLYLATPDENAVSFAKTFSQQNNIDIIYINAPLKFNNGFKCARYLSVEKWLGLMRNADYIVTNSYHGLSFSILFNKKFIFPSSSLSKNSNRMLDLLEIVGLEDRCDLSIKAIENPIDWNLVNKHLQERQEKSAIYIRTIIES